MTASCTSTRCPSFPCVFSLSAHADYAKRHPLFSHTPLHRHANQQRINKNRAAITQSPDASVLFRPDCHIARARVCSTLLAPSSDLQFCVCPRPMHRAATAWETTGRVSSQQRCATTPKSRASRLITASRETNTHVILPFLCLPSILLFVFAS